MTYSIGPIANEDYKQIIDIFNYYVENTFAAFPDSKLPYQAFEIFIQMSNGLPTGTIKDEDGKLLGFGMLREFNPMPAFSHTAEITYFIDKDHTQKGLGKILLGYLEKEGKGKGITNILADISSLNTNSLNFHARNGFVKCGWFKKVGKKNGQVFDTVWMQKIL